MAGANGIARVLQSVSIIDIGIESLALRLFYSVAVFSPLRSSLTYEAAEAIEVGTFVHVPLGKRFVRGVVIQEVPATEALASVGDKQIKFIKEIEAGHKLSLVYLEWLQWLSEYYMFPIGMVCEMAYQTSPKIKARKTKKKDVVAAQAKIEGPRLTPEQTMVLKGIEEDSLDNVHHVHLIQGVTGSGKTEVYLNLIQAQLKRQKQVLFLVPEIALTPQLIQRFAQRLGADQLSVIHSQLTPRERALQWHRARTGETRVLIGTRSALFCPLPSLNLIILDEEHESSFKQEEHLKYHARDAAIVLAKKHGCKVVLGSATPSLESYQRAREGVYRLHRMKLRVEDRPLPAVSFVTISKTKMTEAGDLPFWLSPLLHEKLREHLEKKDQCAIFLNRRGMAQSVFCLACGDVPECPNCSVSLTLHAKNYLLCHYCGYQERKPNLCSKCDQSEYNPLGLGTERIEEDVRRIFPDARVARADRDQIQRREDIEDLISQMESKEIDILVGTQMIAKGLDFPGLNLVGLALADVGLHVPDFRASERTFQILTQVAGRAGRHKSGGGEVLVQTLNAEHPSFVFSSKHDFVGFANQELQMRQLLGYPPFGRLVNFRFLARDHQRVRDAAIAFGEVARSAALKLGPEAQVVLLGPAPAPLAKVNNFYRYHLLMKCSKSKPLLSLAKYLFWNYQRKFPKVRVLADVDPLSML